MDLMLLLKNAHNRTSSSARRACHGRRGCDPASAALLYVPVSSPHDVERSNAAMRGFEINTPSEVELNTLLICGSMRSARPGRTESTADRCTAHIVGASTATRMRSPGT